MLELAAPMVVQAVKINGSIYIIQMALRQIFGALPANVG